MWCEETDINTHKSELTLGVCYQFYLVNFSSITFPPVVTAFYELLENLAGSLNVKVVRSAEFQNLLQVKRHEHLIGVDSDDMSKDIYVFSPRNQSKKVIDEDVLDKRFIDAMVHFYGAEAHQLFPSTNTNSNADNQKSTISHQLRKRRFSLTNMQANELTETNTFAVQPSPPKIDPNETKFYPDNSGYFNVIASLVNDIENEHLKDEAKKEIKRIAIKYAGEDLEKPPQ